MTFRRNVHELIDEKSKSKLFPFYSIVPRSFSYINYTDLTTSSEIPKKIKRISNSHYNILCTPNHAPCLPHNRYLNWLRPRLRPRSLEPRRHLRRDRTQPIITLLLQHRLVQLPRPPTRRHLKILHRVRLRRRTPEVLPRRRRGEQRRLRSVRVL